MLECRNPLTKTWISSRSYLRDPEISVSLHAMKQRVHHTLSIVKATGILELSQYRNSCTQRELALLQCSGGAKGCAYRKSYLWPESDRRVTVRIRCSDTRVSALIRT